MSTNCRFIEENLTLFKDLVSGNRTVMIRRVSSTALRVEISFDENGAGVSFVCPDDSLAEGFAEIFQTFPKLRNRC